MTISVNEQVAGHKITIRLAAGTKASQRRASCECGWASRIGSTEQVMPDIRTHLDAALAATHRRVEQPTSLAPGSSGADAPITWTARPSGTGDPSMWSSGKGPSP